MEYASEMVGDHGQMDAGRSVERVWTSGPQVCVRLLDDEKVDVRHQLSKGCRGGAGRMSREEGTGDMVLAGARRLTMTMGGGRI